MTSDTMASKKVNVIRAGGSFTRRKLVQVAEAGIKPGFAIRVVNNKMYLAKSTDQHVSGICAEDTHGKDIDTAFTITTDHAEWYGIGDAVTVWCYLLADASATLISEGDPMQLSDTDGYLKRSAYTGDITDISNYVGRAYDYQTGSATDNKILRVTI